MIKEEFSALFARVDDLLSRAERGEIGVTRFLSPREEHFLLAYLSQRGLADTCFTYGGYDGAERKRAYILPDYIGNPESYSDILPYFDESPIASVRIVGSGYRKLTHRDYLGSLLSLGIERGVLGDIVLLNTEREEAVLFCDSLIEDFILTELKKIASDTVKTESFEVGADFKAERSFVHISDTVASPRIDCVVAALCSLSRERARETVISGCVEVDFESETSPDRNVSAPAVVSIRGYGKFRINAVSELTRKGRVRLDADKYV